MLEYNSCKLAVDACISQKYFAIAHLYSEEKTMNIHIHDCYELYYSISGGRQFLIDNKSYPIQPGDLFFINQYESHYLSQYNQLKHERIVISIHPDYLKELSTPDTQLEYCFQYRNPGVNHRIKLDKEQQQRFTYYIYKILSQSSWFLANALLYFQKPDSNFFLQKNNASCKRTHFARYHLISA
jgi:hypothetical protein